MAKRKFRIDSGRYGGEYTIGVVNGDFVRYWTDRDESELIGHLNALEWGEGDELDQDSPYIFDDEDEVYNGWYEIDELEHSSAMYGDAGFTVTELESLEEDDEYLHNDSETALEGYHLIGREAYANEELPDDITDEDEYVPVLMFHSAEKGSFGCWFVETDGEDFDPKKFAYSTVETDIGEFVDTVWYDKAELEPNFDYCDTTGKGYYVRVGWFNKRWHDTWDKYDDELMDEYWEGYDDMLKEDDE